MALETRGQEGLVFLCIVEYNPPPKAYGSDRFRNLVVLPLEEEEIKKVRHRIAKEKDIQALEAGRNLLESGVLVLSLILLLRLV